MYPHEGGHGFHLPNEFEIEFEVNTVSTIIVGTLVLGFSDTIISRIHGFWVLTIQNYTYSV